MIVLIGVVRLGVGLFRKASTLGRDGRDEANAAANIKRDEPIMVVLGNPPYSGHSANRSWVEVKVAKGQQYVADFGLEQGRVTEIKRTAAEDGLVKVPTFIGHLMQDYYVVDGAWLDERNPKWLQNDYVKFIRFAQWRIDKTGEGVIGYITSNSYLDSPTFRGMRQSLMQSFNDIYIYDLHGNSNKKERAPDGGEDKNVFDIIEGVSLLLCVKERGNKKLARVFHAGLLGAREAKYKTLSETDVKETTWTELKPVSPNYLFVPQSNKCRLEYEKAWPVTDIFPVNSWGIATRKDYLLVDFDRKALVAKFTDILRLSPDEAIAKYGIKESPHWSFRAAKKVLDSNVDVEKTVKPVLFRPFDTRYVFYDKAMIERGDHRYPLMRHMLKPNISLISVRRVETFAGFDHVFCAKDLSVLHTVSMKEGNFVFPLYLYEEDHTEDRKRAGGTMLMVLFDRQTPGYLIRDPARKQLFAFLCGFFKRVGEINAEPLVRAKRVTCLCQLHAKLEMRNGVRGDEQFKSENPIEQVPADVSIPRAFLPSPKTSEFKFISRP